MIGQSAWGAYNQGWCLFQVVLFCFSQMPSIATGNFETASHFLKYLLNLKRQFAGRNNNQGLTMLTFRNQRLCYRK
jgi:hypothetical protein